MNENEAIKIILDDKKEYERTIKVLEDVRDTNGTKPIETIEDCQKSVQAIETILDLYQQEKEKNKEIEIRLQEEINEVCEMKTRLFGNSIGKDKIMEMKRYREFELQQQYKDFENDVEWKTYNKILEE